jgi:hypothetical protein
MMADYSLSVDSLPVESLWQLDPSFFSPPVLPTKGSEDDIEFDELDRPQSRTTSIKATAGPENILDLYEKGKRGYSQTCKSGNIWEFPGQIAFHFGFQICGHDLSDCRTGKLPHGRRREALGPTVAPCVADLTLGW